MSKRLIDVSEVVKAVEYVRNNEDIYSEEQLIHYVEMRLKPNRLSQLSDEEILYSVTSEDIAFTLEENHDIDYAELSEDDKFELLHQCKKGIEAGLADTYQECIKTAVDLAVSDLELK